MSAGTEQAAADPAKHAVQFYRSEDELAGHVSRYLGAALAAGETAIVVATPGHRRALEARLAADCDVEAARVQGSYIPLNAAEMMSLVLIGDRPDPPSLDLVIGSLIRRALAAGPAVRVYGEMVALLWEAGHPGAALELETLWNGLGQDLRLSSLCGYPAPLVSGPGNAAALQELCDLHTAVSGRPPAGGTPLALG
jgi:MEDS: MEthanogen/methylotroph, DcmR Sensory domain